VILAQGASSPGEDTGGDKGEINAIEILAGAALAIHGPTDLAEKLVWATDAARRLSGAAFAAYIVAPRLGGGVAAVSGATHEQVTQLAASGGCFSLPVPSVDGGLHGSLLVGRPGSDWSGDRHSQAAAAVAIHLGSALDNLVVMNRLAELEAVQREVVHQLQEAVRPLMPSVEAGELGVHYLPADPSAPTGGDLYDWLVLPDGDLHLAVVDVAGKGVAATKDALYVTHALRLLVLDGCPVERLVARVDALLTAQSPDLVCTVMVARYRPSDGRVQLVGGGHPPALVISAAGDVRMVSAPGTPVGWPGAGSAGVATLTLGRQDTLVLYTDGLVEARKDILVGLEGLAAAAAQIARYPAPHLARALVDRALAGAMRRDDSLALVLRRRTPPDPVASTRLAPLEYRFSPTTATVPLARHLLADWLEHLAVDQSEVDDLLLVGSELCANAVRNASGAPGALALRAFIENDSVVVEVEDDGEGFEHSDSYEDEVPDTDAEEGRGLYLVEALTDELTVSRVDRRTVVRAVKRALLPAH